MKSVYLQANEKVLGEISKASVISHDHEIFTP